MNMIEVKKLRLDLTPYSQKHSKNRSDGDNASEEFDKLLKFFSQNVPCILLTKLDHTPINGPDKVVIPELGFHISCE